ncbi:hypothetical protein RSSM_04886 [Rhodopirellula sallentina SM41]|uniref:Uncharacterized protein n=1 Tax=Rhodopirellula sallentina SM41 TaxID=1263870 RepID=M5TWW3_9BACT|nr:hypothetical protein RSSM_04886 [Rhodopirellula sallentina SM41]
MITDGGEISSPVSSISRELSKVSGISPRLTRIVTNSSNFATFRT